MVGEVAGMADIQIGAVAPMENENAVRPDRRGQGIDDRRPGRGRHRRRDPDDRRPCPAELRPDRSGGHHLRRRCRSPAGATGRPVRYADLSAEEARPRFEAAGLPPWLLTQLTGAFDLIRDGLFAQTTDQVEAITGHVPRSIDDFARSVAPAFRP